MNQTPPQERTSESAAHGASHAPRHVSTIPWTGIKVSLMLAALFWVLVYRLSESVAKVPDFVYVNF